MLAPLRLTWLLFCSWLILAGCRDAAAPSPPPPPPEPLIVWDWAGDLPQRVLDQFTAETGIAVALQPYESQEEAIEELAAGQPADVVVMESRFLPGLITAGLLTELEYTRIPNFRNVSANFRDLAHDPANRFSVPYTWGTTGILVRQDREAATISRWADLWDPRFAGKVALWSGQPREVVALTLKSLGYSANSEDPAELEAALARLLELRPHLKFVEDYDPVTSASLLASDEALIAMGYTGDVMFARELGLEVKYILPAEGTLIWGDAFVVPTTSRAPAAAMDLINFLLRPEISAEIINTNTYAMPNDAAMPLVDPAIRNDPVIFPAQMALAQAEVVEPLSAEGQARYDALWERFLAGE